MILSVSLAQAEASPWPEQSIFTNDSPYYLKLKADGFVQRVRFTKEVCSDISAIDLELPLKASVRTRVKNGQGSNWPSLYGIAEADWCWFEFDVSGLDLNQPEFNRYRIVIQRRDGKKWSYSEEGDSILPWKRVLPQGFDQELTSLGAWGANPVNGGGVFFKIWEPRADEVHLFINGQQQPLPMRVDRQGRGHNSRHYSLYLPDSKIGDEYFFKFVKGGRYEEVPVTNRNTPSAVKIDPAARELKYDAKGGAVDGYLSPRAVVREPLRFVAKSDLPPLPNAHAQPWLIYQLWPIAFNPKLEKGKWTRGTFNSVKGKINHVRDLGVTAVELLPVNESRFNAGWGYALNSLTLIESSLGTREDLAGMVDAFHAQGIRVIFDGVLNHINNDLIRDPINPSVRKSKFYDGDTPWGPRPDFDNPWVNRYLAQSTSSWIYDYRVDGIRFDMTKHMYEGSAPGWNFLQELNQYLKAEHPGVFTSAEELPNNVAVTWPADEGGLGFDSQWNDRFKNSFELEFDSYRQQNRKVNLSPMANAVMGLSSHQDHGWDRPFGSPQRAVNYLGSHDFIGNKNPLLRIVAGYQAYEMDRGQTFTRVRPLEDPRDTVANFRQIHNDFTHSTVRTSYLVLLTTPGPALFFQGEELAQDLNIENEWSYMDPQNNNSVPSQNVDLNRYVGSHRMPWENLKPGEGPLGFLTDDEKRLFKGHLDLFKDLIRWRKSLKDFDERSAELVRVYHNLSLLSYVVKSGKDQFLVMANYGNALRDEWITFPGGSLTGSWWREEFNTSAKGYGGKSEKYRNVVPHLGGRDNHIRLAAGSAVIFKLTEDFNPSVPVYLVGSFSNWKIEEGLKLIPVRNGSEWLETNLTVAKSGEFEFHISTADKETKFGSSLQGNGIRSCDGYLSYAPDRANIEVTLQEGNYRFRWNLRTYQFSFEKL